MKDKPRFGWIAACIAVVVMVFFWLHSPPDWPSPESREIKALLLKDGQRLR